MTIVVRRQTVVYILVPNRVRNPIVQKKETCPATDFEHMSNRVSNIFATYQYPSGNLSVEN